jgi:putative membrane protein
MQDYAGENMKKIFLSGALFGLTMAGLGACADSNSFNRNNAPSNANSAVQNANATNLNSSNPATNAAGTSLNGENSFLMKAAQGGMAEVELGRLAAEKAQNAEVKKFAQKMIEDHSNANTELKSLATKKGVTVPSDVGAEHKASMDKLKNLSGAEFDKAYVAAMVEDHKKDVAEFEKESTGASDADVKAFAAKTLPTLKMHLEMIQAIQAKMK